jgi:ATP-dependent Clp protease adaptor protein ClpS
MESIISAARGWKSRHCAITYADGRCGELHILRGVYFESEITPQETMAHETEHEHDSGRGLALETAKPEVARPPLFQVLLLNDDFTPMDFVVEVLRGFFNLDQEQAVQVMLHVHTRGKGVCGVFTREVAETKVTHVNEYSRSHQHPLLCTMEKL